MSQRLNFAFTCSNRFWQPSSLRRSPAIVSGAAPACPTVLAAAARCSAIDDASKVGAPSRSNAAAIPRPMPRLPPVTTTTLPWNSPAILVLLLCFVDDGVAQGTDLGHRQRDDISRHQPAWRIAVHF